MSPEELQGRFAAEIEKRGRDDQYIDGVEERELLQIAIQHGFSTESGRSFLTEACRNRGYVIEAAVVTKIREKLRTVVRRDGRLDSAGFERLVREAQTMLTGTTRTERDVRALVVTTIDDDGIRPVTSWWRSDWFAKLKNELGVGGV